MITPLWIDTGSGPVRNPALSDAEFNAGLEDLRKSNVRSLRDTMQAYLDAELGPDDYSSLALGVAQKGVKALAVKAWIKSVKTLFRTRKPLVTYQWDDALYDFSSCGAIPYSIKEVEDESAAWLPPVLTNLAASPTTAQIRAAINAINDAMKQGGLAR